MRPQRAIVPNEFDSEGREHRSGWWSRVQDVGAFLGSSRGLLDELTAHVERIKEHLVDSEGSVGDMARRVDSYRSDFDGLTSKLEMAAVGRDDAEIRGFISATQNLSRVSQLISFLTERQLLAVTSEKLDRACSDLRRAGNLVEREHAKYKDALEHSEVATVITDGAAHIDDGNPAAAALLAVEPSELAGRRLASFIVQGDLVRFEDLVRSLPSRWQSESRCLHVGLQPRKGAPLDASLSVHAVRSGRLVVGYSWAIARVEPPSAPLVVA